MPLYVLDTNILVHYVRASPVWGRIRDRYHPLTTDPVPRVSVVSEGELRSLASQWSWGNRKLEQLEFGLGFFDTETIDNPEVIRAYAAIDAYCERVGHPLGKNDVWIAATAVALGATLLTTDRDFDRLVPQFLSRDWVDPNTRS